METGGACCAWYSDCTVFRHWCLSWAKFTLSSHLCHLLPLKVLQGKKVNRLTSIDNRKWNQRLSKVDCGDLAKGAQSCRRRTSSAECTWAWVPTARALPGKEWSGLSVLTWRKRRRKEIWICTSVASAVKRITRFRLEAAKASECTRPDLATAIPGIRNAGDRWLGHKFCWDR